MNQTRKLSMLKNACLLIAALAMGSCSKNSLPYWHFDYLPVQMSSGDSWSIIDKNGKEVVKEEYPEDARLSPIYDGVYWVKTDGKYQLYSIDSPKKPISDKEWTRATAFKSGVAAVSEPNNPIRIIDTKGKTITLGKDIKQCGVFTDEGYALFVNTEGLFGVLDTKGKIVIKPIYERLYTPSDGLVLAQKKAGDKNVIILDMKGDKQGEINLDKYYLLGESYHDGKIIVRNADKESGNFIILDKAGKKLFDIKKAVAMYHSPYYVDGFLTFANDAYKYGVADDNGEIIIRAKYEGIYNYGNGTFAAKKGDKWGIINEKDETIIDFDYDDWYGMLGDNFIMKDGNSFSLLGKDGKEITSFDSFAHHSDDYAEFVDVNGLTISFAKFIESMEQKQTVSKVAKELSLSVDDYHYTRYTYQNLNIDGKITGDYRIWFTDYMAEEKTHQETVSDGWFTYNRTVSDGWRWSNAIISSVSGELSVDESISTADLYNAICNSLANGRKKLGSGTYSKNVKINGATYECRTSITMGSGSISLEMTFNR